MKRNNFLLASFTNFHLLYFPIMFLQAFCVQDVKRGGKGLPEAQLCFAQTSQLADIFPPPPSSLEKYTHCVTL